MKPHPPKHTSHGPAKSKGGKSDQPKTAEEVSKNESMHTSDAGLAALRLREGAVPHYYPDIANNCTYGIGTLAHYGPCTAAEMRRRVTTAQMNAQLAPKVQAAEKVVRNGVRQQQLTQEQFDALVSFTYNVGSGGARTTLRAANRGAFDEVVRLMRLHVYVHPRDAKGRRLKAVRIQGLVDRRAHEIVPFQPPKPAKHSGH